MVHTGVDLFVFMNKIVIIMKPLNEALVEERSKSNKELGEISRLTNISLNALHALENGEFQKIPGKFYFINYIKNYLNALGANEKEFFKVHQHQIDEVKFGVKERNSGYYTKLRYTRFKKRNLFVSLFLFILMLAVLFFILYSGKDSILRKFSLTSKPVPIPANHAGVTPFAGTFDPDIHPVNVDIEFLNNCWMQVTRGNRRIAEKVFQKGEKVRCSGYQLGLVIGNPQAVRLLLNGSEVKYLKLLSRRERLQITPADIKTILGREK